MKLVIDRIEGGVAVLLSQEYPPARVEVPARILPAGSGEGDVVTLSIGPDEPATRSARERVASLLGRLDRKP
jgi:hypothetical protein